MCVVVLPIVSVSFLVKEVRKTGHCMSMPVSVYEMADIYPFSELLGNEYCFVRDVFVVNHFSPYVDNKNWTLLDAETLETAQEHYYVNQRFDYEMEMLAQGTPFKFNDFYYLDYDGCKPSKYAAVISVFVQDVQVNLRDNYLFFKEGAHESDYSNVLKPNIFNSCKS